MLRAMKPERLVKVYRGIERTLVECAAGEVRERPALGETPNVAALGDAAPVRRALRRIGIARAKQRGAKARQEAEATAWTLAEHAGASVADVAAALMAFAGVEPYACKQGICVDSPKCGACHVRHVCRHYVKKAPTIKDLPAHERPRERLLALGHQALTDAELLALLIGGGREEATAIDLAKTLVVKAGGLKPLAAMTAVELCEVSGIGEAKAARLLAAFAIARRYATTPLKPGAQFSCSQDIFNHYHELLRDEKREVFSCVFLDAKNRFVGEEQISVGTLLSSPVNPREVFRPAIRAAASSIIFVHNHPSGDPTPSADDLNITRRLVEVGKTIGIRVVDHVIVGDNDFYSFADKGLL